MTELEKDASSDDMYQHMSQLMTRDYIPNGVLCALGGNYKVMGIDIPLEKILYELLNHTRNYILDSHAKDYRPGLSDSTLSLMYNFIILHGGDTESRGIFFRWAEYFYQIDGVVTKRIPKDMFTRMKSNNRPDLDEWGLNKPYFVPLD